MESTYVLIYALQSRVDGNKSGEIKTCTKTYKLAQSIRTSIKNFMTRLKNVTRVPEMSGRAHFETCPRGNCAYLIGRLLLFI